MSDSSECMVKLSVTSVVETEIKRDVTLAFPIYYHYDHNTDYPCDSWSKIWIETGSLCAVIEEEIRIARPYYAPEKIELEITIKWFRDLSEWARYHKGIMDGIEEGSHGWGNDPTGFEEARKTVESTLRLSRCKGTFKDIGPR